MRNTAAYERLTERFARIATIGECASMLGWDAAAMMPAGGGAARGDQLAVLAGLSHAQLTDAATGDELAAAEAAGTGTDPWRAANLALMRQAYTRATALPADLVEAQARANSSCEKVWREARQASDFKQVAPFLAEVLRLTREAASALAPALGLSPYDALMDGNQRGVRAADVAPVFAAYEAFLGTALPAAEERQARQPAPLRPPGPFPIDRQEELCRRLSERLGLDFSHARLDRSAHPFSGGTQSDVRITTRYIESDFTQAVLAVVHETGHALYERGLPTDYARQPVGEAAGMGIHESQSLIVEMQACRSDAFLSWMGPELLATFGGYLAIQNADVVGDPGWVVIDEFAGQWITMLALPAVSVPGLLIAFVLFRLFDITKLGPVGWADRKHGPFGIMADDVIAGLIAALIVSIGRWIWPEWFV